LESVRIVSGFLVGLLGMNVEGAEHSRRMTGTLSSRCFRSSCSTSNPQAFHQLALHRITMHLAQLLDSLMITQYIEIVIALLPNRLIHMLLLLRPTVAENMGQPRVSDCVE
jgi:hypothetical protein